jgi:uncharacterized protein YcsI (UPF0317 family)
MFIEDPKHLRNLCRNNKFNSKTSGLCNNNIHVNILILPDKYANDFELFCKKNNKPCPLIEKLDTGNTEAKSALNSNICSDLPKYNVYKKGILIDITNNIEKYWNNKLVTFLLGCSNSFEHHIIKENIRLKHIEQNKCVAMYKTNIETNKTKYFSGKLVVSMRIINKNDLEKVIAITKKYPLYHGSPLHIGDHNEIGITDITKPDWGDYIEPKKEEVKVFWACGATVKTIVENTKPDFAIVHEPGCMFVTDLDN